MNLIEFIICFLVQLFLTILINHDKGFVQCAAILLFSLTVTHFVVLYSKNKSGKKDFLD